VGGTVERKRGRRSMKMSVLDYKVLIGAIRNVIGNVAWARLGLRS
jgi:hypothetical protein